MNLLSRLFCKVGHLVTAFKKMKIVIIIISVLLHRLGFFFVPIIWYNERIAGLESSFKGMMELYA